MTEEPNHEELTLRLLMDPVDTLFFRDARPFEAATRATSGLPMPQTLAGALRTALLREHGIGPEEVGRRIRDGADWPGSLRGLGPEAEGIAKVRFRGPWFQRNGDQGPLVAFPANLRRVKETGSLVRLGPLASPPPGWDPPLRGMLPLWRRGRNSVEAVDGFLTSKGVRRFLHGGIPESADVVQSKDLYSFEDRTGIGVNDIRNTASEGQIYGIRVLALRKDVHFICEATGPRGTLLPLSRRTHLMPFGGEGRQVRVSASRGSIRRPAVAAGHGAGRVLLLTSPAWFGGWKPSGVKLISAAVPGYQAVSGWDMARRSPKPNRFMVPAGTVYFLSGGTAPPPANLVPPEDAQVGWGDFLEGDWHYV